MTWGREGTQPARPHVFVDETKARGYLLVAAVVEASRLAACRRAMRGLVLPGQRRLHFKGESDARRAKIVDSILTLGIHALVYDARSYSDPKRARDACLIQLVEDLAPVRAERLVLEREDAALKGDNAVLYVQVRKAGIGDALRYDHMRAYEESLLALPDAIAWCWAKGGRWRRRVRPIVEAVKHV